MSARAAGLIGSGIREVVVIAEGHVMVIEHGRSRPRANFRSSRYLAKLLAAGPRDDRREGSQIDALRDESG